MADSYILVAMLTAAVFIITQLMLLPTPHVQVVTITTSEPTIDNKIIETLYSNRVTSANKVLVNKVSSLMTSFSHQKPLTSKIQKHMTVGNA